MRRKTDKMVVGYFSLSTAILQTEHCDVAVHNHALYSGAYGIESGFGSRQNRRMVAYFLILPNSRSYSCLTLFNVCS